MNRPTAPLRRSVRRRGLVSVAMLIGLIILGIVAGSLLKVGLARRGLARMEERQLQVELLADSGARRALARLEADPRYEGEVWEVPSDDLGGRGTAKVTITIKPDPDRSDGRLLVVVADHQVAPSGPIRRTLSLPLNPITPP